MSFFFFHSLSILFSKLPLPTWAGFLKRYYKIINILDVISASYLDFAPKFLGILPRYFVSHYTLSVLNTEIKMWTLKKSLICCNKQPPAGRAFSSVSIVAVRFPR